MKFGGSDDNYVVIGAKVDTKGVEKGIAEIERQTEKIEDIKVNVDVSVADIIDEDTFKQLDDLLNRYKELTSGEVLFESDRKEAEGIKNEILGIVNYIEKLTGEHLIIKGINDVDNTLPKIKSKISQMGNSLERIGKRVSGIGLRLLGLKTLFSAISSSINYLKGDNKQLKNSLDRIQAIVDAVVERVVNALMPIIQKLIPIIEKIANVVLNVLMGIIEKLLPILEAILNFLGEFILYIGNAVGKLFGIDTSAKNLAVNLRKSTKEAKALKKQLAGFDEMTILNKDGSTGALGGLNGSGDNSKNKNKDKNWKDYQEYIGDNADDLLGGLAVLVGLKKGGFVGGSVTAAIVKGIEQVTDIGNVLEDASTENIEELINDSNPIKDVDNKIRGLVEQISGGKISKDSWIWWLSPNGFINNIIDGITETFSDNKTEKYLKQEGNDLNKTTQKVIDKIGKTAKKELDAYNLKDLIKYLTGGEDWSSIMSLKEYDDAIVTYENGMYKVKLSTGQTYRVTKEEFNQYKDTLFKGYKGIGLEAGITIETIEEKSKRAMQSTKTQTKEAKNVITEANNTIKENITTTMNVFNEDGTKTANNIQKQVVDTSNLTKKQVKEVENQTKTSNKTIVTNVEESLNALKDMGPKAVTETGKGAVTAADKIREQIGLILGEDLPKEVDKGITETTKKLNEGTSKLPKELKNIGTTAGTSVAKGIANGVNSVVSKIESSLNGTVTAVNQLMSKMGSSAIMGAYAIAGQVNKLSKVKLPRVQLAKGGIINNPGRGVAVGGERGAEWYQPLTDTQSLDMVADALGKRITLQPTIDVYVGNRLVAREIRKINAQEDFAYNGGVV